MLVFEGGGPKVFTTFGSSFFLSGEMKPHPVEEDRLVVGRLRDAAAADVDAASRGQDDVDQVDLAQLVEHPTRLVAQAGGLNHLVQRLPEHVGQEADQDVGQHAVLSLVPDRPDPQIALVDPKRRLGLGQLDVRLPQVLGRPVGDVAAQQVTAFAQLGPIPPGVVLLPGDRRPAVGCFRTSTSNRPAARLFLAITLPIRRSMTSFFHLRFWQLAWIFSSSFSIRCSNRRCMAASFSRRSRLRHKMKTSSSPSGDWHSFTSSPRESAANRRPAVPARTASAKPWPRR